MGPSNERNAYERLMQHLTLRQGDLQWQLAVLAHLTNAAHQFFQRDYRPPPRKTAEQINLTFNNDDGFFDNIPETQRKSKRSAAARLILNSEQRHQLEVAKIEAMNQRLTAKLQALQQKAAERA